MTRVPRTVGLLVVCTLLSGTGCSRRERTGGGEPGPAAHPTPATVAIPDPGHAGVQTRPVSAASAGKQVTAFGRVLDPVPLVESLHAAAAARAAVAAARSELDRVARLHRDDQNASTRDLETARAAFAKASAALEDARARATALWGPALDAGAELEHDLVTGTATIVRIDLPAGVRLAQPPATVTIAPVAEPDRPAVARVVGAAPTVDPLVQGDAFLAVARDDAPRPGTRLGVTVAVEESVAAEGVAVPASAVLWANGNPIVYVETDPTTFARRAVKLGQRSGDTWVVTDGVANGEKVVVTGAALVLSSEVVEGQAAD